MVGKVRWYLKEMGEQLATMHKILVTDNDQYTRQTITEQLQRAGYAVTEATTNEDTLQQCANGAHPDLVLIDNIALCQQIKQLSGGSDILILFVTDADETVIQQALDCGADDFVLKPVRPVLLRHRIRQLLEMRAEQYHNADSDRVLAEEREIERKLRHNEERLQFALEAADAGIWDWDMLTDEVYFSPRWVQMLGYAPDELEGSFATWEKLIHPDDVETVKATLDAHLNNDEPYRIEHRLKTKSGEWKWIRAHGKVVGRDENGKPTRMAGTHRDIHAQKLTQHALRENETRLSTLIENMSDIIYTLSFEGVFTYVSPNWQDYLGHSVEDVNGKHFREFVHPDDLSKCEEFLRKVIETGEKHRGVEYRVRHKDGRWFWHTSSGSLAHDTDGNALYFVGAAHDITEQQAVKRALAENERRYRIISTTISDYAYSYIVNPDFSLTKDWSTQAFHDITGYTWEEMDADGWQRITHPDDFEIATERFQNLLDGKIDITEFRIITKSGEIRWLRDHGHPYWDEDEGRVTHIYGAAQDITRRRHDEETLKRQAEELRARNDELDAFAYTVAHDLKNPIASMMGFASLMQNYFDRMSDDKVREYLSLIMEGGYKLKDIINALLMLAGVNKMEKPEMGPLDMADIIRQVETRLDSIIRDSNAKIAKPKKWLASYGYAPWVEEIWSNYISNAIKYGGEPPLVELGSEELSDGSIRFWVRDNGRGLTEEERQRVFTPFTRLNQVKIEGHGLGLSVVQRIVEKLGGSVDVKSTVGKGSTFSFTLPPVPEAAP